MDIDDENVADAQDEFEFVRGDSEGNTTVIEVEGISNDVNEINIHMPDDDEVQGKTTLLDS